MKKVALIFLISIYTLSSFGLSIKQFYCCGKLKSTGITFVQQDRIEKCGKSGMGDCCKTKFQNFKVKDTHIASDAASLPEKHFTETILFYPEFETVVSFQQKATLNNQGHAPPLQHGAPLYIYYCTYLI